MNYLGTFRITLRHRWWERLWRWLRYRNRPAEQLEVTDVDFENKVITIGKPKE